MKTRQSGDYPLPPVSETSAGETRRVGFELEFSGIELQRTVDVVRRALDGEVTDENPAESRMSVDGLGEFAIELDWQFLKQKAAESEDEKSDEAWLEFASQAAGLLVPVEVVCPPIPVDRLTRLDPMVEALRRAGAVGTEESLFAAYGVHINTEIPALDSTTLHRYLKAYALLQWWLVEAHEVDPARRLSPYVDLYPEEYLHRVLQLEDPEMDTLFDDYLEHNNTRNRALDLLPILKEIDSERLAREIDDPRIKARPAFHYRMPNCQIEREDWSLAPSWNRWLTVERLAQRTGDMAEMARAFERARRPLLGVNRDEWVETMHRWLVDLGLV